MSKRAASKDPSGRLSKLLKSIDNEKDYDSEDDENDKGSSMKLKYSIIVYFIWIESFIPRAASRRLDDSVDGEDDDLYRPSTIGLTSQCLKDFRSEMELKPDHENRPLWVTPGWDSYL